MANTSNPAEVMHSDTITETLESKGVEDSDPLTVASVFFEDGNAASVCPNDFEEFLIADWENLKTRKHTRRGPRRIGN